MTRRRRWQVAAKEHPAVAIMDLGLPPDPDGVSEGFATLDGLARQVPDTKVIVATSHGDRSHALRAIAAGAYDFCEKPIDIGMLGTIVGAQPAAPRRWRRRTGASQDAPAPSPIKRHRGGGRRHAEGVPRRGEAGAAANVTVLLLGESGTGKEALARALHDL